MLPQSHGGDHSSSNSHHSSGHGAHGNTTFHYAMVKGQVVEKPVVVNPHTNHTHLKLVLQGPNNQRFEIPVNIQSQDGSHVEYQVSHDFTPPHPDALLALPDGERPLQDGLQNHDPLALDFVRQPLFDRNELIPLDPDLVADNPHNVLSNDLKDLVHDAFLDSSARVYAFGSTFPGGVHEIHMNQLNPAGQGHDAENGAFRDGALFIHFPSRNQWFAVFVVFEQQLKAWKQLDAQGSHPHLLTAPHLRAMAEEAFTEAAALPRRRVGAGAISARNMFREAHRQRFAYRSDLLPANPQPFTSDLTGFIPPEEIAAVTAAKTLVFHTTGDTGNDGETNFGQRLAASLMASQRQAGHGAHKPAFLYHLGDLIYPHGAESSYGDQFYNIYEDYPAPILAIPGNHDGEEYLLPGNVPSLQGFNNHFCQADGQGGANPAHFGTVRDKMNQPNPFWVLNTPVATLIGLYTNVDHVGTLDNPNDLTQPRTQETWLRDRLIEAAQRNLPILLMLHHPVYTMDKFHGPSSAMKTILGRVFDETRVYPHAVLAAHVHNYQRFTEKVRTQTDAPPFDVPYLVVGCGGHGKDHQMADRFPPHSASWWPNVTLENWEDRHKGFVRMTITDREIRGEFFRVPLEAESAHGSDFSHTPFDAFVLDIATRRLRVA